MMKGRRVAFGRILLFIVLPIILIILAFKLIYIVRIYSGDIPPEMPDFTEYPVKGVDVSRYQGNIDWHVLSEQDVTFAFIKATEGSSYQDPCFTYNWKESQDNGVYVGAYHFFSYESSGETQAQNFIETVGELDGNLPPVVDLEFYGEYVSSPLSREKTRAILNELLKKLEEYYGVKPIIYTTIKAYYSYILGGGYGKYPLWMRDTYREPLIDWEFWQYSDQGVLEGYDGVQTDQQERYIDLNVYHGNLETFLKKYQLSQKGGINQ